jgi:hypothetical protein
LPAEQIAMQLEQADRLEDYIKDLRALAFQMLEKEHPVPGYKLVAKQSRRQWVDEEKIQAWVDANSYRRRLRALKLNHRRSLRKS